MEAPDDVRASLAVLVPADLSDHEETSAAGKARVARLLGEAGALSWPLVVDGDSGRLWQSVDYRVPPALLATPADQAHHAAALRRAAAPTASTS